MNLDIAHGVTKSLLHELPSLLQIFICLDVPRKFMMVLIELADDISLPFNYRGKIPHFALALPKCASSARSSDKIRQPDCSSSPRLPQDKPLMLISSEPRMIDV